ncbi:MAG: ComEA family DNA-binding protein [Actinobacteria bacterium]|nr:ComEA family DNA-binding protein [Actinomycetota bacterium]
MDIESLRFAIRDRIEDWGLGLTRAQLISITALVIILVAGILLLYSRSRPARVMVLNAAPKREETKARVVEKVVVHVSGSVARPGIYELPKGSRVNDAFTAAGQPLPEADLNSVNLASKLMDGQRVYLPKKGESAPAVQAGGSGGAAARLPLDLNTATIEELDKLPGVGEVLAKRIVNYRTAHGGFRRVEELQRVEGIGARKFENLKDQVRVE